MSECVCVRERKRVGERERDRERERPHGVQVSGHCLILCNLAWYVTYPETGCM